MSTGSATSADGTTIGYWQVGRCPSVVVLHGSNESAASHTQLAQVLASRFTVCRFDQQLASGQLADALITSMYGFGLAPPALKVLPRRRPAFIQPAFDALARTLPHNRCVEFAGLDHGGSSDPGPANRAGSPPSSPRRSCPSSPARGRPGR
jgi:hypothetical protein